MITWHQVWSGGWDAAKIILSALLTVVIVGVVVVAAIFVILVLLAILSLIGEWLAKKVDIYRKEQNVQLTVRPVDAQTIDVTLEGLGDRGADGPGGDRRDRS